MSEEEAPKDKAAARLFQRESLVKEIFATEGLYVNALEVLFDGMFVRRMTSNDDGPSLLLFSLLPVTFLLHHLHVVPLTTLHLSPSPFLLL